MPPPVAERRAPSAESRVSGTVLTVLAAGLVAWSTLRPAFPVQNHQGAGCCSMTDLALNTLLFLPLGAGLALFGVRARTAVAVAALSSVAIELAQLWLVVGRDPSVHDVIMNTLGAWLGAMVVGHWGIRAKWWPVVGPSIGLGVVSWWVVVSLAVRPATPEPSHWFAQWAHQFEGTPRFGGEVISLTLQDRPLPDGPVEPVPVADTVRLAMTVAGGHLVRGPAQLAGVVTGQPARVYMNVSVDGTDLVAYQRLNLTIAEHPGVWLRLSDGLRQGDTVRIGLTTTPDRVRLTADSRGRRIETSIRLAPELFWGGLFFAGDRGIERPHWWSLVIGTMSFVGLGLGLNRRVVLLAAGGTALVLGPLAMKTALPSWPTIGLALIGMAVGRAAAKRLRLTGPR